MTAVVMELNIKHMNMWNFDSNLLEMNIVVDKKEICQIFGRNPEENILFQMNHDWFWKWNWKQWFMNNF